MEVPVEELVKTGIHGTKFEQSAFLAGRRNGSVVTLNLENFSEPLQSCARCTAPKPAPVCQQDT